MSDLIYEAFLRRQLEAGMALAESSDVLQLIPLPGSEPPSRFVAHFSGRKGLVRNQRGAIVEFDRFVVGVNFPDDYLRRVNIPQVLTYLGPHPDPWHPNIRGPFVCLHIEPGTSLVDILFACFEIWTWNLFATGDEGLNHAAAQWSRKQDRSRFPVERRPLKRRSVPIDVTAAAGKEVA
jgi:hypothetical protein